MINDDDRAFLEDIKSRLEAGEKQVAIAEALGMPLSTLIGRCQKLGYRISVTRTLEPIQPVDMNGAAGAAA